MKIQEKPDYLIFADSAKNGECANFPDVSRGWGVTIDQTASKPPLEWMNGAFNRADKSMLYLLQQGVPEWSERVIYPANAIIKYNGVLYTAIVENDNAIPTTSNKWKKTIAEVPTASATQKGVVKLSSAVDSVSETEAATPKAVKTVNDNANSAHHRISQVHEFAKSVENNTNNAHHRISQVHEFAKSVENNTNNAHHRISEVHNYSIEINNRVNAIVDKFQTDNYESRVYSADKRVYMLVRNDGVMGMYSRVKNAFVWYVNHDGWMDGYITSDRIGGLDQFVRDRTPPVGVPMPWPQVHPPAGYFECNGSAFNKKQFPKLAAAYPSGKLPDLRGVFIRGLDSGSGLDPNRGILSYQDDAIRNIYGTFVGTDDNDHRCPPTGAFKSIGVGGSGTGGGSKEWIIEMDASRVVPVAHENRPRNVAFMYIVKAE